MASTAFAQFSLTSQVEVNTGKTLAPGLQFGLSGHLTAGILPGFWLTSDLNPSLKYSATLINEGPLSLIGYVGVNGTLLMGLVNAQGGLFTTAYAGTNFGYNLAKGLDAKLDLEATRGLFSYTNAGPSTSFGLGMTGQARLVYNDYPLSASAGVNFKVIPASFVNVFAQASYGVDSDLTLRVWTDTNFSIYNLGLGANYKLGSNSSFDAYFGVNNAGYSSLFLKYILNL